VKGNYYTAMATLGLIAYRHKIAGVILFILGVMMLSHIGAIAHSVPDITYATYKGVIDSTLPATVGFLTLYLGMLFAVWGMCLIRFGTFYPPEAVPDVP
jgi:hypothetical protein